MATLAKIEPKYCPNISFYVKANYTSWGKNFKVTDGKLTYADGTAIQQKGCYYVKSLAVGDKLGLVYWDGTRTSSGCNLKVTSADHYVAGDAPTASPTLSYWINNVFYPLLDHAGTINLINHNPELIIETLQSKTGGVCLKDHLWHVI